MGMLHEDLALVWRNKRTTALLLAVAFPLWLLEATLAEASSDVTAALAQPVGMLGQPGISLEPLVAQSRVYEDLPLKAVSKIGQDRLQNALQDIVTLAQQVPNFKLAQLIYGDILLAQAQGISDIGIHSGAPSERIVALRDELLARWQHRRSRPMQSAIPKHLLQLSPEQRHAVVIDLAKSRLYLFTNRQGMPRLVTDTYISIGINGARKRLEGDKRTPIGVYFISDRLPGKKLPEIYGDMAFPINYPNAFDRRQGKTGHGIWLHGTPSDTYSRPPRASEGCVILSNLDIQALDPRLDVGRTPVIIAESIAWVDRDTWRTRRAQFADMIERWRDDWQSLDSERYLTHYSQSFAASRKDYTAWARHKCRVNARKTYLKVELSEVSMFLYPGEADMVVVTFRQDYRSNNYREQSAKRQYWQRESDGVWRIIYEGPD